MKIERKRTITLNLSEREWTALEDMCQKTEMSKSQLLRHALAVFQSVKWPIDKPLNTAGCGWEGMD